MAAGCEAELGPERVRGAVIVAAGCGAPLASISVRTGGHPVPNDEGASATAEICELLGVRSEGPAIFLLSGGASSLLVEPSAPITLEEKIEANRLLLVSGADIAAVNTVRKHLSAVKGGRLLRRTRARPLITLILSDVVGDDPSVIGSGPTVPDPTTFDDAVDVVRRRGVAPHLPPSVQERLERGRRGEIKETVKPGDPEVEGAHTVVIGSIAMALAAAAVEAQRLGYEPLVDGTPLTGDTTPAARGWLEAVRRHVDGRRCCALAGGETTVVVRGTGRGGRNQEFALAMAEPMAGVALAALSAATDGIDGPTDAAGAFVDGTTLARARAAGLDPAVSLAANDSLGFFDLLGDLFRCGPTGTNVMDIKIAVGVPGEAGRT